MGVIKRLILVIKKWRLYRGATPPTEGSGITLVLSSPPKSGGAYFDCIAYGVGEILYAGGSNVPEVDQTGGRVLHIGNFC